MAITCSSLLISTRFRSSSCHRPIKINGLIRCSRVLTAETGAGGTNNGVSNYNSLQTTISQRLSQGLQFNANYVWSHMLDSIDSSGWGSSSGNDLYQQAV